MTDAAAQLEAAKQAVADAQAALAKAQEDAEKAATVVEPEPRGEAGTGSGPLDAAAVETIKAGYAVEGHAIEVGALVNGDPLPDVQVRIPIAMLNRHGLVAGATGTGKTRTLQVLLEQLSAQGVPVFAADIKGDLTGVATPGPASEKLLARTGGIGQDWAPASFPTEYFSLGGLGHGVPVRATIAGFGPLLLAKVLGLNATQESSLGLVFHYAVGAGYPLVDLDDLRSVLKYLTTDDGKVELKNLGGLSSATVGVILRELITFGDQGADVFFGEPEIDTADFIRSTADGRGVISLLEVPSVQDKPALFSTFLMWLLADLFNDLPEVGDLDKPKLVFFFDEAHLLFKGASKEFVDSIVQTVRLIRSKGVGIVFVTQTPKDVPGEVLEQLGSRIQHQLRAHTPDAAKALRATVSTYPHSGYDLEQVLTQLGTGEAIVTVMNERGAPTPVAWTRLRAPQGSMSPSEDDTIEAAVKASALLPKYGAVIDRESAHEMLAAKMGAAAARAEAETKAADAAKAQAEYDRLQREFQKQQRAGRPETPSRQRTGSRQKKDDNPLVDFLGSRQGRSIVSAVVRGVFGTLKRR
jgi:DNA helicase HerA-like ATPase